MTSWILPKNFVNSKIFRDLVFHSNMWTSTCARMSRADLSTHSSFTREAMVRGYHVYNSIWEAYIGEELLCQRDEENANA